MVVPGRYRIVLHTGSSAISQEVDVKPDPRAHWTQEQYVARHDFIASLDGELSQIDAALNKLDSLRAKATVAQRRAIDNVYARLTSGILNSEDDQWRPDKLRERLTILLGDVNLSQGPPLPPHLREAADIRAQFDRAMSAYNVLLQEISS
jgi:3-methyladenine DNA glycosylase/8-oxoguanine DNA glycosylase